MNSRAIWKGTLAGAGLSIPVSIHTATRDNDFTFHKVDKNGHRVRNKQWCEEENRQVENSEIKKAFEVSEGQLIILEKEEIESIKVKSEKQIEIERYVKSSSLDPILIERSYFLIPDTKNGIPQAFRLFSIALKQTGTLAIGRFTYRNKEQVGAIRSYKNGTGLLMQTLFYDDEIKNLQEIDKTVKDSVTLKDKWLTDLTDGIEENIEAFSIKNYEDSYKKEIAKLIESKTNNGKYVPVTVVDSNKTETPDLSKQLTDYFNAKKKEKEKK